MKKVIFLTLSITILLTSCKDLVNNLTSKFSDAFKPSLDINPKDYYYSWSDFKEPKVYVFKKVKKGVSDYQYLKVESRTDSLIKFTVYSHEKFRIEYFYERFHKDASYLVYHRLLEAKNPETWAQSHIIDSLSYSFMPKKPGINIQTDFNLKLDKGFIYRIKNKTNDASLEKMMYNGDTLKALVLSDDRKDLMVNTASSKQTIIHESSRRLYFTKGIGLVKRIEHVNGKTLEYILDDIISVEEFEKSLWKAQ